MNVWTFFPLLEQWEQHAQAIQTLRVGEAFVRLPNDRVRRVKTPTLPRLAVATQQLTAVREYYLEQYFRPVPPLPAATRPVVTAVPEPAAPERPPIRRHHPDEHPEPAAAPMAVTVANGTGTVLALPHQLRRPTARLSSPSLLLWQESSRARPIRSGLVLASVTSASAYLLKGSKNAPERTESVEIGSEF